MILGSPTKGRRWTWETPWLILGLGIMTLFAAVDVSVVVLNGFSNRRQTSQTSGLAWRVDKKGCGLFKIVASGVGAQKVKRNFLTPTLLDPWVGLPKGRLPRTRPSGPIGVRPSGWYDAEIPSVGQAFAGWPS